MLLDEEPPPELLDEELAKPPCQDPTKLLLAEELLAEELLAEELLAEELLAPWHAIPGTDRKSSSVSSVSFVLV